MLPSVDIEETCGPQLVTRAADELSSALRRRPAQEAKLAAALQVLIPVSQRLAEAATAALDVLLRRGTLTRPLYVALLRGLVERRDERVNGPIVRALGRDDAGGLVTIVAASLSEEAEFLEPLAKCARLRSSPIAVAAELGRVSRGESKGEGMSSLALRLNESHRIELFSQCILPLVRARRTLVGAGEALRILRDPERHLGRWLCLAEGEILAGDAEVVERARTYCQSGATAARAAWSLVAWALAPNASVCTTRPTLELVARLSDHPSAERELSFLFRMADAGQASAKTMLSSLVRQAALEGECAVRASIYLISDHGQTALLRRLSEAGKSAKREGLRGLALAALHDVDPHLLAGMPLELDRSRSLPTAVWSALVRHSLALKETVRLVTETRCRRLQYGWTD